MPKKGPVQWSRRRFLEGMGSAGALLSLEPMLKIGRAYGQGLPKPGPADWPRFGCDLRNTRFNAREKTIGPQNVERLKLKWAFETGPIQNTPAVVGDTLFFGSWDGSFYALDSRRGELKWKFDAGVPLEGKNVFHDIRSSPQYVEGRLYLGTGDCWVHCLDAATGKEIWKTVLDDKPINEPHISCSVAVYKGRVYVGTSSGHAQLACLDGETGVVRWRFYVVPHITNGGGSIWTSPAIDEQHDIVYNATGSVKSFMPPGPVLYAESVIANDIDTGELLWYDQARPSDPFDLDYSCHPMIFDATHPTKRGAVRHAVGAGNKAGFFVFDRYTGERFWKTMLTNRSSSGGPEVNSTAAAYNRIYVLSNAVGPKAMSVTAALNAYTGDIEWWVANATVHRAPLAVANGLCYQGFVDGTLEALDAETGRQMWKHALPTAHRGGCAIANGTLYTSNGEASLGSSKTAAQYGLYAFTIDGK